jgi:DNA-binding transcriptional MerR regulator
VVSRAGDGGETERPLDAAADFSVAAAARRVGVAGSTLRTWDRRYGLSPSHRTAGGHRRYTVSDLATLQRLRHLIDTGMPTASAAALARAPLISAERTPARRSDDPSVLAFGLATAVEALDASAATATALRVVARLGVVPAWTDVFVPLLQALGTHWATTGEGVEREHLGAAAIRSALIRHTLNPRSRPAHPRMLAVACPDEQHTLPLDALAAALAELHVSSSVLGTLPPAALHAAVRDLAPSVLVLWARSRAAAETGLLRSVISRVPFVCAAGPGWERRRLPRAVTHLNDLPTAVDSVLAWTA